MFFLLVRIECDFVGRSHALAGLKIDSNHSNLILVLGGINSPMPCFFLMLWVVFIDAEWV